MKYLNYNKIGEVIMKPLIYFDFELIDDKNIKISKARLKEILEEVYI